MTAFSMTGALAGRRRAFWLIKMQSTISAMWLNRRFLMVAPILPPEGARRVAGGGDRRAIGTPGSRTSYAPPRMGRRNINAPMERLCRCNPCVQFGPPILAPLRGLIIGRTFLGVLVAMLPPPQATRSARSAGKSVQLSQPPSYISTKLRKSLTKSFSAVPGMSILRWRFCRGSWARVQRRRAVMSIMGLVRDSKGSPV